MGFENKAIVALGSSTLDMSVVADYVIESKNKRDLLDLWREFGNYCTNRHAANIEAIILNAEGPCILIQMWEYYEDECDDKCEWFLIGTNRFTETISDLFAKKGFAKIELNPEEERFGYENWRFSGTKYPLTDGAKKWEEHINGKTAVIACDENGDRKKIAVGYHVERIFTMENRHKFAHGSDAAEKLSEHGLNIWNARDALCIYGEMTQGMDKISDEDLYNIVSAYRDTKRHEQLAESAKINTNDMGLFPFDEYDVRISRNDYGIPCFHVIKEDWDIKVMIDNGAANIIKSIGDNEEVYHYVKKNAKRWLNSTCAILPKVSNRENAKAVWLQLHN